MKMDLTVEFDRELFFRTIKIQNVIPNTMLSAKLSPSDPLFF